MARARSARVSAKVDAVGVTDAAVAVDVAVAAGATRSVAKERRARLWGKARCVSWRALRRERMLPRPNRLAHAATASRAWVNLAKARTGQAVAIRDESVAMAGARSAAKAGPKAAVKVAAGVHAAPDAMSPMAMRRQPAWPQPWTHRVFFPWVSQIPTKLLIKRESMAIRPSARPKRANHWNRANAMTVARVAADAMGVTGIADANAWIKPRAWTLSSQSAMARRRR